MNREARQMRTSASQFTTREQDEGLFIEGYFSVFNSNYEMWPGATESIAPGAFTDTLGNDVRALINHDTRLVLGRNKAGTLELREDSHGLWGRVRVNPNDQDAVNLYERVKRGDVDQCSFGFEILEEDTEFRGEDVHWTIRKVNLFEVSVCTFPAYQETAVSARQKDYEALKAKELEEWKIRTMAKLKGVQHGTESSDA